MKSWWMIPVIGAFIGTTLNNAASFADEGSSLPVVLPQSEDSSADEMEETKAPAFSGTIREKAARGRLEKKIQSLFRKAKLSQRGGRKNTDDYYVVAKFHLPLETRKAELRFDVLQGLKKSSEEMTAYLASKPPSTVRQFKIVYRFKSAEKAKLGLEHARQRYDRLKDYQARMLAYVKRADSMRRC